MLTETLDEPGSDGRGLVVRGKHWLTIGDASHVKKVQRKLAFEMFHEAVLTFSAHDSHAAYRRDYVTYVIF